MKTKILLLLVLPLLCGSGCINLLSQTRDLNGAHIAATEAYSLYHKNAEEIQADTVEILRKRDQDYLDVLEAWKIEEATDAAGNIPATALETIRQQKAVAAEISAERINRITGQWTTNQNNYNTAVALQDAVGRLLNAVGGIF